MRETLVIDKIKNQISNNPIIIYIKGTPESPRCGFSSRSVAILSSCVNKFYFIDILCNPDIRFVLPKYSNWPTFPQLFVKGDLVRRKLKKYSRFWSNLSAVFIEIFCQLWGHH